LEDGLGKRGVLGVADLLSNDALEIFEMESTVLLINIGQFSGIGFETDGGVQNRPRGWAVYE